LHWLVAALAGQRDRLANLIKSETRFDMGCEFKQRRASPSARAARGIAPICDFYSKRALSGTTRDATGGLRNRKPASWSRRSALRHDNAVNTPRGPVRVPAVLVAANYAKRCDCSARATRRCSNG
jgi:hypothetical protein